MRFRGKLALITGGGSGIGEAVATAFAQAGAAVVVADKANAKAVADKINASGGRALAVAMDVTDPESVDRAFTAAQRWHGQAVDILINSAGIMGVHPLLDYPPELFRTVLEVNVVGSFICAQRAAKGMADKGNGRIVNLSSVSAARAGIGRAAYGTSKAAVSGLTRQLAMELGPLGITANAVAPGPVVTAMTADQYTEETIEAFSQMIPAQRLGTLPDMTDAILFLAGEGAGYINGVVLPVDGGLLASGVSKTGSLRSAASKE
jgi:NAD(P)-dependent dehydrogenase (short-subunit alcohol dehydrogenase family)